MFLISMLLVTHKQTYKHVINTVLLVPVPPPTTHLQVDQGLNLQVPLPGGRKLGFSGGLYNRMVASATHFMQVRGGSTHCAFVPHRAYCSFLHILLLRFTSSILQFVAHAAAPSHQLRLNTCMATALLTT